MPKFQYLGPWRDNRDSSEICFITFWAMNLRPVDLNNKTVAGKWAMLLPCMDVLNLNDGILMWNWSTDFSSDVSHLMGWTFRLGKIMNNLLFKLSKPLSTETPKYRFRSVNLVMETCYGDWLAMKTCYGDLLWRLTFYGDLLCVQK